jgi:hypothetical protein
MPFLKIFYDATMHISGSLYVTSNIYMKEVFALGRKIRKYCENDNQSIASMAFNMKSKYDRYWGNPNGVNMILLIAVVLDPRSKLDYVNHYLGYFFEKETADVLKSTLLSSLKSIYREYQGIGEGSQCMGESQPEEDDDDDIHGMGFYVKATGRRIDARSELDKYLSEECEPHSKSVEFDILNWWKVNSSRYPILASIAREVLAIPVSTVASKSAFSAGGRVLGPHRSNLTPKIVETLVCTQDWLRGSPFSNLFDEDLEELETFEQGKFKPFLILILICSFFEHRYFLVM